MKRTRSVRAYVVQLVAVVTLPFLGFGAFLLIGAAQTEQQAIATTAHERAQGAAADLDRELYNLQDFISVLATSYYRLGGDFAWSYPHWTSSLKGRNLGLLVRDSSGQSLLNTCTENPRLVGRSLDDIIYTTPAGEASISDLMEEPVDGELLLTIDLLVWRADNSVYVLSLCVLPRILRILTEQHFPNSWTATIVDRRGRAVSSVTGSPGGSVAAGGEAAVPAADRNLITEQSDLSDWGYTASSPVNLAAWTVSVHVPADTFFGPVRRSLMVLLVAGGGTLALALVLAANVGRRIAGPITHLIGIARTIGDGGQVSPPLTGSNEANLVANVLCSTSEDLNRRTAELTKTVKALRYREKQLRKLSGELQKALEEKTELLNRMVSAQESERQRIARELHDSLGQYFAAMLLGLNAADQSSDRHDEKHQRISDLKTMTSAMSEEVHRLSWELRPTALDDFGLEAAIANYLERWGERFKLNVDFAGNLRRRRLPAPVEITLYRVLQEAMTNVAKHAHAERISVILEAEAGEVRLIVEDDGIGFSEANASVPSTATAGFGLIGIRERLALVGGSLMIEPASGRGAALFCRIPAL